MQFKGTPKFPANVLDKAIAREGGEWNAFTFLDWTTYYEIMPADKIDLALQLEVDRMINSAFDEQEVESERTVIISERQGNENEPLFLLGEEVQAAAFRVHPYHHIIIGDLADLKTIQRSELYNHYRNYYLPNNAVLAIAGDFQTQQMVSRIKELYESIPAGAPPPRLLRQEPPQRGEKQVMVTGPGETMFIQIAHHAPAASHPDFLPFMVLDSLLTGPSNLNLFSGGISNKTSRLYQALVDQGLAVSVYGSLQATIDPSLYNLIVTIQPGHGSEEAIQTILAEIEKLQGNPPQELELLRAVKQARALFAYGSESISNQAFWLGFAEMFASYEWFTSYLERLASITPQDVQRIAQTYLIANKRIIGIYVPDNSATKPS